MSLRERLLPAPLLSLVLLGLWLTLAGALSVGQVLVGLALGVVLPRVAAGFGLPVRVRRPRTVVRYAAVVFRDVLASNLEVARGVVFGRWQKPRSRFVVVPLDLRDPVGLSVLAMVTTVVPGTVWSELALDRSALLLHVWDVVDDDVFVAHYKDRYERPLCEIFE